MPRCAAPQCPNDAQITLKRRKSRYCRVHQDTTNSERMTPAREAQIERIFAAAKREARRTMSISTSDVCASPQSALRNPRQGMASLWLKRDPS